MAAIAWFVGSRVLRARRAARNPEPAAPEQRSPNGVPDPGVAGTLYRSGSCPANDR
ncbi:hypothetical protein ACIQH6_29780 [Micromonospora orduensis]|uniref:hypothetical protein n=1 Tax=Micromonospora orduensis TaxID=1420891 RepID=UPI00380E18E3